MSSAFQPFYLIPLVAVFLISAGIVLAADPSAPARDNIPRIWRALSGDRVELDGRQYALSGVTCPDPDSTTGREAKALLNIFLLGSKHSPGIACSIFRNMTTVECRRGVQTASALMIDSGLCQEKGQSAALTGAGTTLSLNRFTSRFDPVSYWRLRSCIGVHPGHVPSQCHLASRTWPLRYAEAARWLEMQNFSRCPTGIRSTGSGPRLTGITPGKTHAPLNRNSLRPLFLTRCRQVNSGH